MPVDLGACLYPGCSRPFHVTSSLTAKNSFILRLSILARASLSTLGVAHPRWLQAVKSHLMVTRGEALNGLSTLTIQMTLRCRRLARALRNRMMGGLINRCSEKSSKVGCQPVAMNMATRKAGLCFSTRDGRQCEPKVPTVLRSSRLVRNIS